ncbi:ATP-binding protein [Sporosarcina jiandibaonis]|uniref:ATP-binding protein n=1 Tax=Sporosarcina jiandibaonis TaxID=2715535 RepID=UPI001557306D
MQDAMTNIFSMFGIRKMEDLYFKCYPDDVSSVSEARLENVKCPVCEEMTLTSWVYKQNGDWLQKPLDSMCSDCQKAAYAKKLRRFHIDKRQKIIDADWYFISETDESGFRNFSTVNPETKEQKTELIAAKTMASDYVKKLLKGEVKNLRISGTPGTGKTHLSKAIARVLKHEGKDVAFITADKLFDKIKATFGNDLAKEKLFEQFSSFDYVVIDDVGVETHSQKEMSWTINTWVRLIDLREGKSTVYTTNFDEKTLQSTIGARAESRMSENAERIAIYTPEHDYRKVDDKYKGLFY